MLCVTDFRRLHRKPSQVLHRWFFKGSAWTIYAIACGLHFFKLHYNERTNQVEETQYHRTWSKIVVALKVVLLVNPYLQYFVLGLFIYIHSTLVQNSKAQNFLMSVIVLSIVAGVLRRLLIFLHLKRDRRFVKHIVNEILQITRALEQKFGMEYKCDFILLVVYLVKLWILAAFLDSLWHKPHFLSSIFLYWVLMEYCFAAYFVYQLILLSWYHTIILFLQRLIEDHENRADIEGRYNRRLILLFELHLRINNLHKYVRDNVSWLTTSVYMMIFTCVFNAELLIECSLFAGDELENKLYIIADGCLGPVCIPILYVLILGMCTDRFRDAEIQLQQLFVIVHSLFMRKVKPLLLIAMVLDNEHTSLIIHQKLKPLQNMIILGITCDREFVMDYIVTVILTALSLVQYTISTGGNVSECETHK
ncbi:uncharacterized protein CG1339 [Drosophila erecta]|uniref:Gustatory receptor n=1 Tax=Drosophila erecta TaxID=7220 RepID=B3N9V9_DROER|nr:uncharacterized protein CG1339 [Drosophila erecta]EDV59655.1 uncharacterized protein Dere_GG10725 [Drosophila erecta]